MTGPNTSKTKTLVMTGLLFAVAIVLSVIENQLPPLGPVPGVKFGLSNIVVMFCLFFLKKRQAFALAVLKSLFAFITRGPIAAALSLSGGIASLLIMILLLVLFKDKLSYSAVSICGAVTHNIAQFVVVSLLFVNIFVWAYLPVLVIAGIVMGLITSVLLKLLLPILQRLL